MALIGLQDVHKMLGDKHLLRGVSFVVEPLERVGLLGPNGSGKSTLLRILAGAEEADEGQRTLRRETRIGLLEQEPTLDSEKTIRDEVRKGLGRRAEVLARLDQVHTRMAEDFAPQRMEGLLAEQARLEDELERLGGHDVEHRIAEVLTHLGLPDAEARCGRLSGGEKRRVALAQVLLAEPDLLLLDEPTNHLDALATQWLEQFLATARATLVMVTHDRYFLDRVVGRILEIDRGTLHSYDGGYHDFLAQRAQRLDIEQKTERTRLNLLRRESAWMRRGPPARTTKAKARVDRFHQLEEDTPEVARTDLDFAIPSGPRLGDRVLMLEGVRKAFDGRLVIPGLDIEIGPGDRLGVVGPNGAGKSTFLGLCTGALEPDAGSVSRGPTVTFAEIDQGRSDLDPQKTVLEEVAGKNDHVLVDGRALRVESFLERFLFSSATMRTAVGKLSGGERNRVLLAKLLSQGGNVLVLDEPTNDLDLMTLRVLEEALLAFAGAVLVVSHDRYFLDRVATRILYFDGAGGMRVHEGDLSLLLEKLEREALQPSPKAKGGRKPKQASSTAAADKLSSRERAELNGLPPKIETVESALAVLDERLGDPALYGDPAATRAVTTERTEAQRELDSLYQRWEELEGRNAPRD